MRYIVPVPPGLQAVVFDIIEIIEGRKMTASLPAPVGRSTIDGITGADGEFVEGQMNRMEIRALIGMHSARAERLSRNLDHADVRAEMSATSTRIGALASALERLEQAHKEQQP